MASLLMEAISYPIIATEEQILRITGNKNDITAPVQGLTSRNFCPLSLSSPIHQVNNLPPRFEVIFEKRKNHIEIARIDNNL